MKKHCSILLSNILCFYSFFSFKTRIIELNGGQPPLTYKRFQTLISRMEPLEMPVATITPEVMQKCTTPVSDDHDEKYGVPSLEELGKFLHRLDVVE